MKLYGETPKIQCASALKYCMQVINSFDGPQYYASIKALLGFCDELDLFNFRSAIDLCEDTEYALINYFGSRLFGDIGEKYLRAYGVLNAIFLQRSSIFTIAEMTKYKRIGTLKDKLSSHNISYLRNVMGSHTLNMNKQKNKNNCAVETFKIMFQDFEANGSNVTLISSTNSHKSFNLHEEIVSYSKESGRYLCDITVCYMENVFKSKNPVETQFYNQLRKSVLNYDFEY